MEKVSLYADSEAEAAAPDSLVKKLEDGIGDLHIHNDISDDSGMSNDEDVHEYEEYEEDDGEEQEEIAQSEHFSEEPKSSACACSTSSPAGVELLSAIKGSREKQGTAPRELKVTWAPDVYDPPPTKLQDMVSRGTKQPNVPKKEKEGRKGKESFRGGGGKNSSIGGSSKNSSRAGGGKDKKKKQNHRANGRCSKSFGFMDYGDADDF